MGARALLPLQCSATQMVISGGDKGGKQREEYVHTGGLSGLFGCIPTYVLVDPSSDVHGVGPGSLSQGNPKTPNSIMKEGIFPNTSWNFLLLLEETL